MVGDMFRSSMLSGLFVMALLCVPSGASAAAGATAASANGDVVVIYETLLDNWTGKRHEPLNLAQSAEAPTIEDTKQYADCAKEIGRPGIQWVAGTTTSDLRPILGKLSHIHFVDPNSGGPWTLAH